MHQPQYREPFTGRYMLQNRQVLKRVLAPAK